MNFVKQYIGDAIANYPKIPASKLNEVVEDASIRMVESLKTAVTTDKKDGIEALLNGSDDLIMANEVRKMLESDLVISIEEVTKLDAREATKVASSVFPVVLKRFCEAFDAESLSAPFRGPFSVGVPASVSRPFGRIGSMVSWGGLRALNRSSCWSDST